MAHPNEQIARTLFQAVDKGDVPAVLKLLADDYVLHVPGKNAIAGTYKGKEEAGTAFKKMEELTGGTLKRDLHDVTASDTHAVTLVKVTAERGGQRYSWNGAAVLEIRGGKIAEQWLLADDLAAVDATFK